MPNRIILEQARSSPTLQALTDGGERAWFRLTTACDDYGRFDADPIVLLAELFKRRPAGWTVRKMTAVLLEWQAVDLVHYYALPCHPGRRYGHALTFLVHQRRRDSKPKFPEPPCGDKADQAHLCLESIENARQPGSCGDSPQLAARARTLGSRETRVVNERRESFTSSSPQSAATSPWPSPAALVALYNRESPEEAPAVVTLSVERRRKAQQYLRQFPDESWWREVFAQMHRSPFLRGRVHRVDRKAFVADFDWLLTKGKDGTENSVKVHDGRYRDG